MSAINYKIFMDSPLFTALTLKHNGMAIGDVILREDFIHLKSTGH